MSIGLVGAADAAAYYLDRAAGCDHEHEHGRGLGRACGQVPARATRSGADLDYYTGDGAGSAGGCGVGVEEATPAGRWLGEGAAALGLTGAVDAAGGQLLRALLAGRDAAGEQLVGPVLRVDPRSRLSAGPLVRALEAVLPRERWDALTDTGALRTASDRLDAGRSGTLPVEVIARVATAAGLDPVALYRSVDGTDTFAAALAHAGGRVDIRRAGLDVTLSAPKSVSVLFGLSTPQVATAVRAAHAVAVREVVAYLQRHAARPARGHHGGGRAARRIGSDGLIVAAFEHHTSRTGDPQLHTHLVVPNLVRGNDGRWSALDTRAVYRHARTGTAVYQAVLRGELTRTLGVGWDGLSRGIGEVAGVPRGLRAVFSKRRAQITAALAARALTGAKAAQAACLATRPTKTSENVSARRERWQAEARAAGFDPADLNRLVHRTTAPASPDTRALDRLAGVLFGPTGVTREQTTFTRQDLAQHLCDLLPAGTPLRLRDLDRLVDTLIRHADVLPVIPNSGTDGAAVERRYTTVELVSVEQHALSLAATPAPRPVGTVDPSQARALLGETALSGALSAEQYRTVLALVTAGRRLDVIAGPPGSGKTAALHAAHHLWTQAGHPVLGATLSRQAAQNLQHATGIPTTSVTALQRNLERQALPAGAVLVLDEASLINTRTLATLLDHVDAAHCKLVLVGDPLQLPEIGAGGLFAALADRPDTLRLTSNQRQSAGWERVALARYRTGDLAGALHDYASHDRVHTADSTEALLDQVAVDYTDARRNGGDVLVLAARRADVDALNTAIRTRLSTVGVLGDDELTITVGDTVRDTNGEEATRGYRVGDQVMVTVNDRARGLINGTRGTVAAVDQHAAALAVHLGDGRTVTLDRDWLATGHLAHGYAITVHKGQGLTVDTTLIYGGDGLSREHGYVALSRGRTANHLYLAPARVESPDCGPPRRTAEPTARDLTADLLERLQRTSTQQLASTRLAHARERVASEARSRLTVVNIAARDRGIVR
ncbi:MAG TPA: MobF family relaxase [Mycobacteriales bacterium]|nr:MobF family relaxase [Mycobacteriales bacterium]